jgi:site-specific DNA-methyltransferase (adenine-specific)
MARKPLIGTVADNVLEYGVGGLNIDGCRIGTEKISAHHAPKGTFAGGEEDRGSSKDYYDNEGRFPANIIFECTCENPKVVADKYDIRAYNDYKNTFQSYEENDKDKGEYEIKDVETTKVIHTDPNCPCYILDEQSGTTKSGFNPNADTKQYKGGVFGGGETNETTGYTDKGGASRFFYCPKASKSDRDEGLKTEEKKSRKWRDDKGMKLTGSGNPRNEMSKNIHPTVKPTELMKYLIRLVTPKGGVVLDPFMGSGSTGKAAVREGMEFIGIEREEEYYEIAKQRIENETNKRKFW